MSNVNTPSTSVVNPSVQEATMPQMFSLEDVQRIANQVRQDTIVEMSKGTLKAVTPVTVDTAFTTAVFDGLGKVISWTGKKAAQAECVVLNEGVTKSLEAVDYTTVKVAKVTNWVAEKSTGISDSLRTQIAARKAALAAAQAK